MVLVLRLMAGYWLGISTLILVLYDWKIRHRLPMGIERIELVILIPGLLFLIASFVISYRNKRLEARALEKMFPHGLPVLHSNDRHAMGDENRPVLKTGAASPSPKGIARPSPKEIAQTTSFALEKARELLVANVLKNGGALQEAVRLLAKRDASAADGLSQIHQAIEAVRISSPDGPS